MTLSQWWASWSAEQVWARGTRQAADQAAASVTFGDVRMRDVRLGQVQAWVASQTTPKDGSRGIAASTMKMRLNYVRMALPAAARRNVIPADPSRDMRLPKVRRAEAAMVIPTSAQVSAAIDAAPVHFRAFIAVCAFAGLRLGEAAGLQVGDVDFLGRKITVSRQIQGATTKEVEAVPPKAGSERTVPVPAALVEMLSRHAQDVGVRGAEQWLLTNGVELWNRNSAAAAWRGVRARTGMGDLTLHSLRHFYASALIADGCDVVTVQRALGHTSAAITLGVYSHLWSTAEDRTRAAATRLMDDVLGALADPARTESS